MSHEKYAVRIEVRLLTGDPLRLKHIVSQDDFVYDSVEQALEFGKKAERVQDQKKKENAKAS